MTAEALLVAERRVREEDRRSAQAQGLGTGQTLEQVESTTRYVLELQSQLTTQTQERSEAENKGLLAEARLKKVVQDRDRLEAELAELGSAATSQAEDPSGTVPELMRRLSESEALLAAERQAREEDRRSYETRGQVAGQTNPYAENALRYIDQLQTRLRAKTAEHLDTEENRLVAEDKLHAPKRNITGGLESFQVGFDLLEQPKVRADKVVMTW